LIATLLETRSASESVFETLKQKAARFDYSELRALPDATRDIELRKVHELADWFDDMTKVFIANDALMRRCTATLNAYLEGKACP
jgi:hypothetical protein